jgi:ribosomal protein S12 methylthiotransferase
MSKQTFFIVSLGCAKNTVDSESMAQLLQDADYRLVSNPEEAGALIVNTCGFIKPAREESLSVLKELAANKRSGQFLIAAGCLTQRYGVEVARQVKGIDGILGTRRWMDIVEVVSQLRKGKHPQPVYHLPNTTTIGKDERGALRVAVHGNSAYIKIADGCRRPCAFCAIPLIKGTSISRPQQTILEEAQQLHLSGIRELILIAQDTTDYGRDLGLKNGLARLLEMMVQRLRDVSPSEGGNGGVEWIRVMYAFPGYVTDDLINVMATYPQILPYLDLPLQHAHPQILRKMQRPANIDWVYRTLEKMRSAMPDLALRTTFIVGYPGETEAEFQTLLDFVEATRFDRVGAFKFSFESGTPSEVLGDPVPEEVKQERWERLMELQQPISLEKNQAFNGKRLDVLIEGHGDGISLGRSYRDAPEIDGLVIIEGELPIGKLIPVTITGAMPYDLSGTAEDGNNIVSNLEPKKV